MLRRRWRAIVERLDNIHRTLDVLERRYEKMETILMVREPGSAAAAEAYDGLRKQVVNAVSERMAHLTQLAQFDAEVAHGADGEMLGKLVDGWLEQAGLTRVDDPDHPDAAALFQFVNNGDGAVEVFRPAYVDGNTGRLIRTGMARRVSAPPEPTTPATPAADTPTGDTPQADPAADATPGPDTTTVPAAVATGGNGADGNQPEGQR